MLSVLLDDCLCLSVFRINFLCKKILDSKFDSIMVFIIG